MFGGRRAVVFVHGCFWHGHHCPRGDRAPRTNAGYWAAKIARNRARDAAVAEELSAAGWARLVLCECELRDPAASAQRLRDWLGPARWSRRARLDGEEAAADTQADFVL